MPDMEGGDDDDEDYDMDDDDDDDDEGGDPWQMMAKCASSPAAQLANLWSRSLPPVSAAALAPFAVYDGVIITTLHFHAIPHSVCRAAAELIATQIFWVVPPRAAATRP